MHVSNLNGIALHYQLIGAAGGRPTIVFINSLGTDFRIWRDVVVRLAGDFSIVLYDKRGHGLSDIGATPYSIGDHVQDLAALIDHLQLRSAVLCGLSVGGLIAQGLYAARPELVGSLILCDAAHKIGTADFWRERISSIENGGIEAIADGILQRWFTPTFRAHDNAEFAGYRNMLTRQPVAGYVATCAAIRDADFTEAARRIAVPTLCIVGDQDGSTPPDLVLAMAKLIPGARYEVIAGAGHIPCVEQPEAMHAVMRSFLGGIAAGEAENG